jgi:biotin carboxyl carrier protein
MKKTLRISFNGKSYDVVAEILGADDAPPAARPVAVAAAAAAAIAAPAASAAARSGAAGVGEIPSPLAGKIVSIDAAVGTRVKAGQKVVTLEAMKMNTIVSAPADGTVATVHVNPGDSVEEGQLLITLR